MKRLYFQFAFPFLVEKKKKSVNDEERSFVILHHNSFKSKQTEKKVKTNKKKLFGDGALFKMPEMRKNYFNKYL